MAIEIYDENKLRELPVDMRLSTCEHIIKNDSDESKRWDAIWLVGEIAEKRDVEDPVFLKAADLMEWVLKNDDNGVVKHEACYQIAGRNMRTKIPVLVESALNDKSILTKHEAIESLGLMRAFEAIDLIRDAEIDPSIDVRETARFVIKRLQRLQNQGEYKPADIL
ncbi:MAG: HEAT repeat domain-containing protein [Nitrosopumilus sp.]|nr:HEAT repeat domain-containing protein [Nitrosopumilus sp.]MBL7015395.1 HEAT repeat domain-containing protein [Nitrosopumilus sp.]MBL7018437.1 HEAT repeat domain-containing protein [Nitrosopumilus sp.]